MRYRVAIKPILDFIDANLDQPIQMGELASLSQAPKRTLYRHFLSRFGVTPYEYVIRRRVERACEMMLSTDTELAMIARQCGFTDQPHMTRLFRQRIGEPPGAWRLAQMRRMEA